MEKIIIEDNIHIDLSFIAELIDDSPDAAKSVIKLFINKIPESIQQLKKFCEEENKDQLSVLAHHIKSSLSVIQINNLIAIATSLENCRQLNLSRIEIEKLLNLFETTISQSIPILLKYMQRL